MQRWYILIVYFVHGGSIYTSGGAYPVAYLFHSQADCQHTLDTLHLSERQKAVCAPVAPMKVTDGKNVQVTQEEWIQSRLHEMTGH